MLKRITDLEATLQLYANGEEPLMNNESIKRIIHGNVCLGDALHRIREEKEDMLKHITDLEEALTELNNDWLAGNDMDEAFTKHFKKFSYLRAQSKAVHDTQQDDDGYEPPEHMTADDFNEMHSGPYQPDDTGYMDGDYE
jgi:DNA mismatch repair ATPase MutS